MDRSKWERSIVVQARSNLMFKRSATFKVLCIFFEVGTVLQPKKSIESGCSSVQNHTFAAGQWKRGSYNRPLAGRARGPSMRLPQSDTFQVKRVHAIHRRGSMELCGMSGWRVGRIGHAKPFVTD